MEAKRQVAAIFPGCGALGSVQAAAFAEINKYVHFSRLYGTSSGAINVYGNCFTDSEHVVDMWSSIDKFTDVFKPYLWQFRRSGFVHTAPLRKKLKSVWKPYLDKTQIYGCVARLNNYSGLIEYADTNELTTDEFLEASIHSASIACLVSSPDPKYSDGGARELAPLKRAIEQGCEEIYIFMGKPFKFYDWTPKAKPFTIPWLFPQLAYGSRSIDIMLHEIVVNDVNKCIEDNGKPGKDTIKVRIIAPEKAVLVDPLEFSDCKKGVELGRFIGKQFVKEHGLGKKEA